MWGCVIMFEVFSRKMNEVRWASWVVDEKGNEDGTKMRVMATKHELNMSYKTEPNTDIQGWAGTSRQLHSNARVRFWVIRGSLMAHNGKTCTKEEDACVIVEWWKFIIVWERFLSFYRGCWGLFL